MISTPNLSANQCVENLLKILSGDSGCCDFSHLSESDWLFILELARWHRIARPLMNSIIDSNIGVPDYFLISLQKISKKNAANNLAQTSQLPIIKKAMDDKKVRFLFIKGIFLSMQLHQSVIERHSKDIDIWVPENKVVRAVEALRTAGFELVKPNIDLSKEDLKKYMDYQKDMVFKLTNNDLFVEVELHWRLDKNCFCFPLSFDKAYSRHEQVVINNRVYPTMSLLDNYFYLSSHGTNALYGRIKWFLDWQKLCNTIEAQPELMSRDEIIEYAKTTPTQFRQMSLSHYLHNTVSNKKFNNDDLPYHQYSIIVKLTAKLIINSWANLRYMRLIKRWCLRFLLVKGARYKFEQIRLALKLFLKKGVYE